MKTWNVVLCALACLAPVVAQAKPSGTQGQHVTRLRQMEDRAKNDVKELLAAASYAKDNGLPKESERILNKVLKLDPDNEPAHRALGFTKYKGQWMLKKKAEELEKSDTEAEMKAKGMEWVDGLWVPKEQAEEAKKGIFKWENEIVTKEDYKQLAAGKVRHPRTGELIEKADLEKAGKQFPLGGGKWGDEAEANKVHADPSNPWVVESAYCTILGNAALSEIEAVKNVVSEAYETCKTLLGREPKPKDRLVIYLASGTEDYRELGNRVSDEGSSYGAALSRGEFEHAGRSVLRLGICNNLKDWASYYARHAVGLAYVATLAKEAGIEPDQVPLWFVRAVGGYAERFYNDSVAAHFGRLHIEKGGVTSLTGFFKTFAINGEIAPRAIDASIYQAALILDFARRGPDKASKDALAAVLASLDKGQKELDKGIKELEKAVAAKEKELREYLKDLSKK